MDIQELAYQRYQLDWMMKHNHSIDEIIGRLEELRSEDMEAQMMPLPDLYGEWLQEDAFGGECFACFGEFLENEYLNENYMFSLLTTTEFHLYLNDRHKIAN